ncbi:hypothetical protein Tco_0035391, partial [Tanacetum coccineum]
TLIFESCTCGTPDSSIWIGLCEDTHDFEFRTWYLKMRGCLEEKLPVVLKDTGMFEKKNIDPAKYKISFRKADHVPK